MTDYLALTEFVPGTKAKAQDVNANFAAVKDAINAKASGDGDSTKTFNVADATADGHAVNKGQLDTLANDTTAKINGTSAKFCMKSGNIATNGFADLLSSSGMNITAKVGGIYPNLVISNYKGEFSTISSIATSSMTGKIDGIYNIFVKTDGTIYALANNIYKQAMRPTMLDGDVWLNTSVEPIKAIKYSSASDVEFLDVPLGKVTIASNAITKTETFAFNQNGYNVQGANVDYVVENWASTDGNSWYRKYKSGLIEQGGSGVCTTGALITFPTAFSNAKYTLNISGYSPNTTYQDGTYNYYNRTATSFNASKTSSPAITSASWHAYGC